MNEKIAQNTETPTNFNERYQWKDGVRRVDRPMDFYLQEMLDRLRDNQVVIVQAETGVGKTSRIPQAIFDAYPSQRIYMTQPRRDSTRMNAGYIAEEMGVELGGDEIDYSLKDVNPANPKSRLKLMVDQSLVNKIIREIKLQKKLPDGVLIIDEAHQRSLEIDKLLVLIHHYLPNSPNTKIVITSATIDTQKFAKYFSYSDSQEFADIPPESLPIVAEPLIAFNETLEDIDDREYHLKRGEHHTDAANSVAVSIFAKFLLGKQLPEEKKEILRKAAVIGGGEYSELDKTEHLTIPPLREEGLGGKADRRKVEQGTVLVFLPGKADIEAGIEKIKSFAIQHGLTEYLEALPMYRHLDLAEKKKIEEPVKPGTLRIVFTTEILKSSITAPETVGVIDSFQVKRDIADEKGISRLRKTTQSGAESDQAKGRTGRTTSGFYIPILGGNEAARRSSSHPDYWPVPEILRGGILSVILEFAAAQIDIRTATLIDRPSENVINGAIQRLVGIGAITPDIQITPFGRELLRFPLSPEEAKSLFVAAEYDVVPETAKVLAAIKEEGLTWFPGKNQTKIVFSRDELSLFLKDLIENDIADGVSFSYDLEAKNAQQLLKVGEAELKRLKLDRFYAFSEDVSSGVSFPTGGRNLVDALRRGLVLKDTSIAFFASLYHARQVKNQLYIATENVVSGYGEHDATQIREWIVEIQRKINIDRTSAGLSPVVVTLRDDLLQNGVFPKEGYRLKEFLKTHLDVSFEGSISEMKECGISENAGYYELQISYTDAGGRQVVNPLFQDMCEAKGIYGGRNKKSHIYARNVAFWRWKQFAKMEDEKNGEITYSQSDYDAIVAAYDAYISQKHTLAEEYNQKNTLILQELQQWCEEKGYSSLDQMLDRLRQWEKMRGKGVNKPKNLWEFSVERMRLRRKYGLLGGDKSTHVWVMLNKWCDAHSLSAISLAKMRNTVTELLREARRSPKLQEYVHRNHLFRGYNRSGLSKAVLAGLIDNVSLGRNGGPKAQRIIVGSDSVMNSQVSRYVFGGIRAEHLKDKDRLPRYFASLCAPIKLDWLEEVSPQVCARASIGNYKDVDGRVVSDFIHTYLEMEYAKKEHEIEPEHIPEAVATLLLRGGIEGHPLTEEEKEKRTEIQSVLFRAYPAESKNVYALLKEWYIRKFNGCTTLTECLQKNLSLTEENISEIIGEPYQELKNTTDVEAPLAINIRGESVAIKYGGDNIHSPFHAKILLPVSICKELEKSDVPIFKNFLTILVPDVSGYGLIRLQASNRLNPEELSEFKQKIEKKRREIAWDKVVTELGITTSHTGYGSSHSTFQYIPTKNRGIPELQISVDGPLNPVFDTIIWDSEKGEKIHFYLIQKSLNNFENTKKITWYIACTNDVSLAEKKQKEAEREHERLRTQYAQEKNEENRADDLDIAVILLLSNVKDRMDGVVQSGIGLPQNVRQQFNQAQASATAGQSHWRNENYSDAIVLYEEAKRQLLEVDKMLDNLEDSGSTTNILEQGGLDSAKNELVEGESSKPVLPLLYFEHKYDTWMIGAREMQDGSYQPVMKPKKGGEDKWQPYKGFKSLTLGANERTPRLIELKFQSYVDFLRVEPLTPINKPPKSYRQQYLEAARTKNYSDLEVHLFNDTRKISQPELIKVVREGYGNQQTMQKQEWRYAFARLAISGEHHSGLYNLLQVPFNVNKIQTQLKHIESTLKKTFNSLDSANISPENREYVTILQAEYVSVQEALSVLLPLRTIWKNTTLQKLLDEFGFDELNKQKLFAELYTSYLYSSGLEYWNAETIEEWFYTAVEVITDT
jgi:HrpA-like RNA helicase